jgi:tetratricopeptide (TPR) repeat protein
LISAAVTGRGRPLDVLLEIAGINEIDALHALDELMQRGLVCEDSTDPLNLVSISHDKIREVVYAEAGGNRRRVYHRRALPALEAVNAPPAELAHHALAAGMPVPAFRYSLAAGQAAMSLFALRDAIRHFEQARALLQDVLSDAFYRRDVLDRHPLAIADLHLQLGRAYELLDQVEPAESVYQELLAHARAVNQPQNECTVLNRLATLAVHRHDFERAVSLLQAAIQVAERSGNNYSLAQCEWELAQLRHHQFDFPASLAHSQRALTAARELGDRELVASALNALGYAHLLLGRLEPARAALHEARELFASQRNRALEADCLTALAAAELWVGRWQICIERAREAAAISLEIENPWGQVYSATWLAAGLLDGGAYEEALVAARAGREVGRAHDFMPVTLLNLLVVGGIYRTIGQLDRALEAHLEAATLQSNARTSPFSELISAELCADYFLLDNQTAAQVHAHQAIEQRAYHSLPLVISPHWLETKTLLLGGEAGLARSDATAWGELTRHVPRFRLVYLRSLAVLARREGDLSGAMASLEEALALASEMDLPGQCWQVLADLAELHESIGEEAQARQKFTQAVEILEALAGKFSDSDLKAGFLSAERIEGVIKKRAKIDLPNQDVPGH